MASLVITKYQLEGNNITTIKCLAAVKAVTGNAEPDGEVNSNVLPKISKGNKEYGIRPRFLRLIRTANVGTDENDKKTYRTRLIVLAASAFGDFNKGDTVTFNGHSWTVAGKNAEDY